MTDLPERPNLELKLSTGQKLKMVYGIEMDLRRLLPDPQTAMELVMTDAFTQDYVLRRCLATNLKQMVEKLDDLPPVDEDLEPDDRDEIVVWAVSHVMHFFMTRAAALGKLGARYKATLPALSSAGSTDSNSTTPSAGPLG